MERIVRVWIGHEYLEYDIDVPDDVDEDVIYEAVVEDVYNTLSIEVI